MNKIKIPRINQPRHERKVLSEFLNCLYADNPVEYKLKSRKPDEPDALVRLPDKEEYYELARILDHRWFNLRTKAIMNPGAQVNVNAYKFDFPEKHIVESKLEKKYTSDAKDIHLLLYYDKGFFYGGCPPDGLVQLCDDTIKPLLENGSLFKRLYLFDRRSKKILWQN